MPRDLVATWPSRSPFPRPPWVAVASLILVVLSAATAMPANAEPRPTAEDSRSQLTKLQKEYDAIAAAYNANRVALAEARRAEAAAKARLNAADDAYDAVRSRVAEIAQLRYQSPPLSMTVPLQGGKDPHAPIHAAAKLGTLMMTMPFHAFFGISMMMMGKSVASTWYDSLGRTWGASVLEDQSVAGGMAWAFGEIPRMIVVITIAAQWGLGDHREARRVDRHADRDGEAELKAYNDYLANLNKRSRQ
ncbi:cytochrome c oxidase assembly protein [Nonomuraea sp. NPDC049480]|uniref:cytochrome c oxidase assembly protein n=1 Tax=Nonomuraea sp. NPDC049480 TaxID=3364353 RepID=UPI00378C2FAF